MKSRYFPAFRPVICLHDLSARLSAKKQALFPVLFAQKTGLAAL